MKKTVMAAVFGLMTAAAFAGMNDLVILFSTPGPDTYADGTKVLDGECYALVWTKAGCEFQGINADGTAVGDSKIALVAPLAKDGKCPLIQFELPEEYVAANFGEGTWGVYLLDTRKFDANGQATVQGAPNGKPVIVNSYGKVADTETKLASATATAGIAAQTKSSDAFAQQPTISAIKIVGENVYVTVKNTSPCLMYGLQEGTDPASLKATADQGVYGDAANEITIVTPKKGGSQFFKVNRK